ncbi:hypothetical protein ACJJIQ_08160 [Microbulbifer sp. ANSA003]|uniref:hypothetical protein n=1 Tax=Microbulbifer sp. ANSA003 TaxID=3243360 RepID=UPI00404136DE
MKIPPTLKKVLLAALAYTWIEATVAALGRRVLLTDIYDGADFFDTVEPSLSVFLQGMSIHFLAGLLVSLLFARMWTSARPDRPASPVTYVIVMGLLHWVLAVYGYIPRHHMTDAGVFLGLETLFVAITFALYGLVLSRIFKRQKDSTKAQSVGGRQLT